MEERLTFNEQQLWLRLQLGYNDVALSVWAQALNITQDRLDDLKSRALLEAVQVLPNQKSK